MGILFFLAFVILGTSAGYLNNLDGPLHFQCPARQTVTHMFSIHDNGAEDRQFDLSCSALPNDDNRSTESCFWTRNYVNDLDKPFAYSCPTNSYIAGMDSIHDNGAEDRRWKFYCCSLATFHLEDCDFSGWLNTYDHNIDYTLPAGRVLRGVVSIHDNGAEDRIYDFEYCKLRSFEDEAIVG